MKAAIIQSSYIPWRGYFDIIASVDVFVFLEDVQYTRRDWRNRNRLLVDGKPKWISVPVRGASRSSVLSDVEIDYCQKWVRKHLNTLSHSYASAPHTDEAYALLADWLLREPTWLSELNIGLIGSICEYLGIGTETVVSTSLKPEGVKTERLIDVLRKIGADCYLSGPSAIDYLDVKSFKEAGISLELMDYEYTPYPQASKGFVDGLSIIDLIANMGPSASRYIRSARLPQRVR